MMARQPNITIRGTAPRDFDYAVRAAKEFMDEFPDRKPGVSNLVGIRFQGDATFCVWKTEAGNITVFCETGSKQ
jgi:hypothetical protein